MLLWQRFRTAIVLGLFTIIYIFLAVSSYTRESATWDEPQHLTAGYAALTLRDYSLDVENPPFLDMWAALPLLFSRDVAFEGGQLPRDARGLLFNNPLPFSHRFLFDLNGGDRLLYRARFMIVLLGLLLGWLVFFWARDLMGWSAACAALFLYSLEPNLLAHARLVTTDLGVTCFVFGTVYFLWRTTRSPGAGNLIGLSVFFALALVTKFTALLLVPIVMLLLLVHAWRKGPRAAGAAALIVLHLLTLGYVTTWAFYGFRYAPTPGPPNARFELTPTEMKGVPALAAVAGFVDRHHLLPNACSMGFVIGQHKAGKRADILGAAYRGAGIHYFPIITVLKTPLLLMILMLTGLGLSIRHWRRPGAGTLFLLLPMAVFLGVAIVSGLNVCLRHLLPVYPFGVLLATRGIEPLLARHRLVACLVAVLWVGGFATVYPHYLAYASELIGGTSRGYRYLADSDLDWGQDLKGLKRWMDENGVQHVNLAYFGSTDPAYYGIASTRLGGTTGDFGNAQFEDPRLPGYVAVSVTHLHGIYLPMRAKRFYRPLLDMEPRAVIGHSIRVYWVDRPWW